MFDLLREIGQTLRCNKLRTALTGFAVAWGIFMLIVLLSMAHGLVNSFSERMGNDTRSRTVTIWGGRTTMPYKGYKDGRRIILKESDLTAMLQRNSNDIKNISAYRSIDTAKVSTTRDYLSDGLNGVFPLQQKTNKLNMTYGRFINDRDLQENRRVMVLHASNAALLFGDAAAAVGKRVESMKLSWLVIGVYEHDWEKSSYIPFTTAMKIQGNDGVVSNIVAEGANLDTYEDGENFENALRGTLAQQHEFNPADRNGVWIWNRFTDYITNLTAMNILTLAMWVIGLFTLLSGIVGVSNIMFVSVRERTHEIGIRRAIGAKPRQILIQIVAESAAITTIFGYIGIVAGTALTGIISYFMEQGGTGEGDKIFSNITIPLSTAIYVTIVLIVSGTFAGLFPAIKATKVKPVEALRDE